MPKAEPPRRPALAAQRRRPPALPPEPAQSTSTPAQEDTGEPPPQPLPPPKPAPPLPPRSEVQEPTLRGLALTARIRQDELVACLTEHAPPGSRVPLSLRLDAASGRLVPTLLEQDDPTALTCLEGVLQDAALSAAERDVELVWSVVLPEDDKASAADDDPGEDEP